MLNSIRVKIVLVQVVSLSALVLLAQLLTVLAKAQAPANGQGTIGEVQPSGGEAVSNGYVLRANAIQSTFLPEAMAEQQGVEPADDKGIVNVVVLEEQENGGQSTVPAEVTVVQEDLAGQRHTLDMHASEEAGYVSYFGTFTYDHHTNFRFHVTAEPEGSNERLTVEFEDAFPESD